MLLTQHVQSHPSNLVSGVEHALVMWFFSSVNGMPCDTPCEYKCNPKLIVSVCFFVYVCRQRRKLGLETQTTLIYLEDGSRRPQYILEYVLRSTSVLLLYFVWTKRWLKSLRDAIDQIGDQMRFVTHDAEQKNCGSVDMRFMISKRLKTV